MSLEEVFYILAIICMSLYIVSFILLIILFFYAKNKLSQVFYLLEKKITLVKETIANPKQIARKLGGKLVAKAIHKVGKILD